MRKERIKPHKQWWNNCPGTNVWVLPPQLPYMKPKNVKL
jgi:hypothetical protein